MKGQKRTFGGDEMFNITTEIMITWVYMFGTFIKLYPENGDILLYVNYVSIK